GACEVQSQRRRSRTRRTRHARDRRTDPPRTRAMGMDARSLERAPEVPGVILKKDRLTRRRLERDLHLGHDRHGVPLSECRREFPAQQRFFRGGCRLVVACGRDLDVPHSSILTDNEPRRNDSGRARRSRIHLRYDARFSHSTTHSRRLTNRRIDPSHLRLRIWIGVVTGGEQHNGREDQTSRSEHAVIPRRRCYSRRPQKRLCENYQHEVRPVDNRPRMTLPNFLIIGAAKAGTTSLYHYLQQHPDVFMSPVKEPRYYWQEGRAEGRLEIFEREEYEQLFSGVTSQRAVGEATTHYL